jgi:hypothetical protein
MAGFGRELFGQLKLTRCRVANAQQRDHKAIFCPKPFPGIIMSALLAHHNKEMICTERMMFHATFTFKSQKLFFSRGIGILTVLW